MQAPPAQNRSYTANNFLLDIGGDQSANVKKFEGLAVQATIATHDLSTEARQAKSPSVVKWSPGRATIGADMGPGMYKWINQSLKTALAPKDGAVTFADHEFKARSKVEFRQALLTSVGFPRLDGSSNEPIYLDVEFQAEACEWEAGRGEKIKGNTRPKQRSWLSSNFKFDMGGLPCNNIATIDAFTWKCTVILDEIGISRQSSLHPSRLEVSDIKVSISMADYLPWVKAAKPWFVDGKYDQVMQGSIALLGPDLKTTFGTIALHDCGFKSLSNPTVDAGSSQIARFQAEFYVERIEFEMK